MLELLEGLWVPCLAGRPCFFGFALERNLGNSTSASQTCRRLPVQPAAKPLKPNGQSPKFCGCKGSWHARGAPAPPAVCHMYMVQKRALPEDLRRSARLGHFPYFKPTFMGHLCYISNSKGQGAL